MKRNIILRHTLWAVAFAVAMALVPGGAAARVTLTALDGTGGTGGEGYASLVDGKIGTKMGHSFDPSNPDSKDAYIIIKASEALIPVNYFLITGGDTGSNPGRNWADWTISAANFASDAEAVREAEAWTVVDDRSGEVLPAASGAPVDFQFNVPTTTAYQYYKIEVTKSVQGTDVWLQMAEFGLGTSEAFFNQARLDYLIVAGDRNDDSSEGLSKLFDGNNNTKWGNVCMAKNYGETESGAFFIIKTSRPIAPNYYKLVTGSDNATWTHRNWHNWQIYGIESATAPSREAEGWVLLDKKVNVGEDVLPDKNSYTVYFSLSEENATKYQYFKVEIDDIMSGSGYMQMSEFALGDDTTLAMDRNDALEQARGAYDTTLPCQRALTQAYEAGLQALAAATDPFGVQSAQSALSAQVGAINQSINAYADYKSLVDALRNHYDNHTCLTGEGRALIGSYLNENVAPGAQFANGSVAYIMANLELDAEGLNAESIFANGLLEQYASDLLEGGISDDLAWDVLDGTNLNGDEGPANMFDKDSSTKWCCPGNTSIYMIAKASEPFAATYYKLTTANDSENSGRNWKTWKIYGANFADDADATRAAEGWTLLDAKNGNLLPNANFADAFFNMSAASATPYQYYRVEVEAIENGNIPQMAGLVFGNMANFRIARNETAGDFEVDYSDLICQKSLVADYASTLSALRTCATVTALGECTARLKALTTAIEESVTAYEDYGLAYAEFDEGMFSDFPSVSAWAQGYANESVAPCATYARGTHQYISDNRELSTEEVKAEVNYLKGMIRAAEEGTYVLLGGHTNNEWGDGFYGNLIDGVAKNYTDDDGNEVMATKWGGQADGNGGTYIMFRTLEPTNPYFYTLTTGNDTGLNPDRNWGTWYIYGANFEGDGAVSKDADGWVLVDVKENVGKDRLHPVNCEESYFGFSTETTVPYTYYKIVVTKAFSGPAIQMNEIHFGTADEFNEIRAQYTAEANEFDYDIVADQALIDRYKALVDDIQECVNMEALFRINLSLQNLRDSITESASVYACYNDEVGKIKAYLAATPLDASPALTTLQDYLNSDEEPSEAFPNGTHKHIMEAHELNDSTVMAEAVRATHLQAAAVAAGYGKGADISSMIENRQLARSAKVDEKSPDAKSGKIYLDGWEGIAYSNGTNKDKTMSAAEFCATATRFDLHQTLTNLKNGFYQLKLNAGYRPANDIYSLNYAAKAYAGDVSTYVPAVIEDKAPKEEAWLEDGIADMPIINENDTTDTLGYVIWGVQGSCNAFSQGRYEIAMVARVTDGTLTFGVRNDGASDGVEWTAVSNFRLSYLGETEADAGAALAEAAAYNAARITTLTDTYVPLDAAAENYAAAPNFATADKQALQALSGRASHVALAQASAVFDNIYTTKKGYAALCKAKNNVYDKWIDAAADQTAFEDYIYTLIADMEDGNIATAAAAREAKTALYNEYPDYLAFDESRPSSNISYDRSEFAYDIVTSGKRPYVGMSGFYGDVEDDRYVLKFEYKADQPLENGILFYATPDLVNTQCDTIPTLEATSEWKTVYVNAFKAVREYGFGAQSSWLRWDVSTTAGAEDRLNLSARNFRLINESQMIAEGGDTINTGVRGVASAPRGEAQGIYNLAGQRVSKAGKGIYIVNGKKVLR